MIVNKLKKAIYDFEDVRSTKTFAERISDLRQALIWEAFASIKHLNGEKSDQEVERENYKEIMDYFKDIEKLYANDLKLSKLTGKKESDMDAAFMDKLKSRKSTMGDIVQHLTK